METQMMVIGIVIGLVYAWLGLFAVVVTEEHVPAVSNWVGTSLTRGVTVLVLWVVLLPLVALRYWVARRGR